jgi:HSP20 family molecular chaperone IbpA
MMITGEPYCRNDSIIYPGIFEAPAGMKDLLAQESKKSNIAPFKPPVYITEENDFYRIEIRVPGFKREDFFIMLTGHALEISAVHKYIPSEGCFQSREPNISKFISRRIELPENADTDFVLAEYKEHRLYIFIQKNIHISARVRTTRVIVY